MMKYSEFKECCLEIGKENFKNIFTDNSKYLEAKERYDNYLKGAYSIPEDIKCSDALSYTVKYKNDIKAQWKRDSATDEWRRVSDEEIKRMNILNSSNKKELKLLELDESDIMNFNEEQIAELEARLKELKSEIEKELDCEDYI